MIIIPAVDILGSKCVRLTMGDYERKKEYEFTPVEAALHWEKLGASRLHLVDLDGAVSGSPNNLEIIKNIVSSVNIPVEVGGGIRNNKTIEEYFDAGVSYIILGSILFKDIKSVTSSLQKHRGKIIAGLDTYEGKIAISGWKEFINISVTEAINNLRDGFGINTVIITDIKKDGMLSGVNIELVEEVSAIGIDVIASGGVSSLSDIVALKDLNLLNLRGVITGKALYDGRVNLAEAIKIINNKNKVD